MLLTQLKLPKNEVTNVANSNSECIFLTARNVYGHKVVSLVSFEFYGMVRTHFYLSFPVAVLLLVFLQTREK